MISRTWRAAVPAIGVLMLCSVSRAQVSIPATEAVGPPPAAPGTGLNGFYFHVDDAFQGTIVTLANAQQIAMGTPTAIFTATALNYGNSNDDVPVQAFLDTNGGTDGDTLMPLITDPVGSAVFDMKGYLSVPDATFIYHFGLNSDDGSLLTLGQSGITAITNGGDHAPVLKEADITFEAPGLYPIEILFYNDRYMGGIGGQILQLLLYSGPLDPTTLYQSVP
jgi:hypothetical protein